MSTDPRHQLIDRLTALRMPQIPQAAVDSLAAREFSATDPDDRVTATVSGAGELLRLEISATHTRGEARQGVGAAVVSAVNAALAEAEAAQRALLPGGGDVAAKLDEITAAFTARMDGLLSRLDAIEHTLPS